ncbi:MAG TPA: ferritin [Flavobacteriales bacterium]|nr:ferritin [Flavobacteriales bacterium]HRO38860.1 ferritin [Flavobacteriales bacterium]HRP81452.1 ferritin [Flavobacteriales bacterium]HRQ84616.1 ferritin [Flavobacteriales bacterium]
MVSRIVEQALNAQVAKEAISSQIYLAMASWAEVQGLEGIAAFLYSHSDEERMHTLKLMHYINERGGHAVVPALPKPPAGMKNIMDVFKSILQQEIEVSADINAIVDLCLKEKDYTTHNFMQWYVAEQIEEERLARTLLDKLNLIGNDKAGLYLFDRDLMGGKGQGAKSQ